MREQLLLDLGDRVEGLVTGAPFLAQQEEGEKEAKEREEDD